MLAMVQGYWEILKSQLRKKLILNLQDHYKWSKEKMHQLDFRMRFIR